MNKDSGAKSSLSESNDQSGFSAAFKHLLQTLETSVQRELQCNPNQALAPAAAAALKESGADVRLHSILSQFGFRNNRFVGPVNARSLLSQLKLYPLHSVQSVGRGAYATVYRAHNRLSGEVVILKKVVVPPSHGLPFTSVREVSILKDLSHENIVRLIDVTFVSGMQDEGEGGLLYLVMESLDEDLRKFMQRFTPDGLGMSKVKKLLRQLLSGLSHAHSRQVMHRDLKPENVLIDTTRDVLKVADFGLARNCAPGGAYNHQVVTLNYRTPELLLGSTHYDKSIDMWSCGCIFAELLLLRPLFYPLHHAEIEQLFLIFQLLGTPTADVWPEATKLPFWNDEFPKFRRSCLSEVIPGMDSEGLDLLEAMMQYNPAKRITATQALKHPFLAGDD